MTIEENSMQTRWLLMGMAAALALAAPVSPLAQEAEVYGPTGDEIGPGLERVMPDRQ